MKNTKSLNTDIEERIPFGPWNLLLTKKEIDRIYKWRRKSLLQGHCIRCAKELMKSNNLYCPNCETDHKEFAFEADLKNREKEIKDLIKNIRYVKYKIKF